MNVRRQYTLPNCTLILEGLSDDFAPLDETERRPLLSILTNVECRFVGIPQILQGGRTFFENLVKSVSAYAQECLSGVRHPQIAQEGDDWVHLQKIGANLHLLIWHPPTDIHPEPIQLKLTTVQLFDLVDAVDQFFADHRTLPDLSLTLQPVSRRYRQVDEPVAQRLLPFSLGFSGLLIAAIAFFLLPVPEVRRPEPKPQLSPSPTLPKGTQAPPSPGSSP